jgi:hypothetical protein
LERRTTLEPEEAAGTGAKRVCTGAGGEDDGAMVEKRVAERAHNGSWLGTHVFWEERINMSGYIYIAQTYQQWFSTRTIIDNLNTYQQRS